MFVFHLNNKKKRDTRIHTHLYCLYRPESYFCDHASNLGWCSKLIILLVVVVVPTIDGVIVVLIVIVLIFAIAVLFLSGTSLLRFDPLRVSIIYLFVFIAVLADGPQALAALIVLLRPFELLLVVAGHLNLTSPDSAVKFVCADGRCKDTLHQFLILSHLIERFSHLLDHNEVGVVRVELEEFLQVVVGRWVLAHATALKELEKVLGRDDFHRVLLGLGLDQLFINGSIEEIIETYVQLHQS